MWAMLLVVAPAVTLPVYWYCSYRRVRKLYDEEHRHLVDESSNDNEE